MTSTEPDKDKGDSKKDKKAQKAQKELEKQEKKSDKAKSKDDKLKEKQQKKTEKPKKGELPVQHDGMVFINSLRPTQFDAGDAAVIYKRNEILAKYQSEGSDREEYWNFLQKKKVVPVVRGPGRQLYLTDHHHMCKAILDCKDIEEQDKVCYVHLRKDWSHKSPEKFWAKMKKKGWCYLSSNGLDREPSLLRASMSELVNNPYRSLAWALRKLRTGWQDLDEEFAEFKWADYLRERKELQLDLQTLCKAKNWDSILGHELSDEVLNVALPHCHDSAASGLLGYLSPEKAKALAAVHDADNAKKVATKALKEADKAKKAAEKAVKQADKAAKKAKKEKAKDKTKDSVAEKPTETTAGSDSSDSD